MVVRRTHSKKFKVKRLIAGVVVLIIIVGAIWAVIHAYNVRQKNVAFNKAASSYSAKEASSAHLATSSGSSSSKVHSDDDALRQVYL